MKTVFGELNIENYTRLCLTCINYARKKSNLYESRDSKMQYVLWL